MLQNNHNTYQLPPETSLSLRVHPDGMGGVLGEGGYFQTPPPMQYPHEMDLDPWFQTSPIANITHWVSPGSFNWVCPLPPLSLSLSRLQGLQD